MASTADSTVPCPVTRITSASGCSSRLFASTSRPPMSGICKSVITISNVLDSSNEIASRPPPATVQAKPTLRKLSAIASACDLSLSTTSTRIGDPALAAVEGFGGMSRSYGGGQYAKRGGRVNGDSCTLYCVLSTQYDVQQFPCDAASVNQWLSNYSPAPAIRAGTGSSIVICVPRPCSLCTPIRPPCAAIIF